MRWPLVIRTRGEAERVRAKHERKLKWAQDEIRMRNDLLREIGKNEVAMRVLDTAYLQGSGSCGALIRSLVEVEVPPFFDPRAQAPPLGASLPTGEEADGA